MRRPCVHPSRTERFGLPTDPSRDVIMIGPGPRVAPYRGFLQQRESQGATGRKLARIRRRHFGRRISLPGRVAASASARACCTAWTWPSSRDSTPRAYVQDRLREAGKDLFAWLEGGAHLYVCGDAEHHGAGRARALVEIVSAHGGLERDACGVVPPAACRRSSLPAGRVLTMAEQSPVERIQAREPAAARTGAGRESRRSAHWRDPRGRHRAHQVPRQLPAG